jgi:hypothetical protein
MAQGMVLMAAYGLVIAHLWGIRRALDAALVGAVVAVFPYMAQIYAYNTAMATYPTAHLLAAVAVSLSVRRTWLHLVGAVVMYAAAFSVYQSVVANAATILAVWFATRLLETTDSEVPVAKALAWSSGTAVVSVVAGGLLYVLLVWALDMKVGLDSVHGAASGFGLHASLDVRAAAEQMLLGWKGFFLWPEPYLPGYLKSLQLILMLGAFLVCLLAPTRLASRGLAAAALVLATLAPRILQVVHPEGQYHNLTLTAYAVVVAGFLMIVARFGHTLLRNVSVVIAALILGGYVVQDSWISTVNHLNTLAHYSTMTQVLARLRSLPADGWDGKTVVVGGSYAMSTEYPYRRATGVASQYMDPVHMQRLARLMRDEAVFIPLEAASDDQRRLAAGLKPWPHPSSVGIVDGAGVVLLSSETAR